MKAMAVGKSRGGMDSEVPGDGDSFGVVRDGNEGVVERERSKVEEVGWVGKKALGDRANGWRCCEGWWSVGEKSKGADEGDDDENERRGCMILRRRSVLWSMLPMEIVGHSRSMRFCWGLMNGEEGVRCGGLARWPLESSDWLRWCNCLRRSSFSSERLWR